MTIRIILADEHKIMRQGLRTLLDGEADMEVVAETDNGKMTLELAKELRPDVIILDISMSDLNGIEASRQLLSEYPQTRIIALSMHSDSMFVRNMLKSGASGYLLKDCASEELVQAMHTVMRGKTYISPGVTDMLIRDVADEWAADTVSVYAVLTSQEREVLKLLAEGKRALQISDTLGLSTKSVEAHRQQLMTKLDLRSVAELTKYAIRHGLTSVDE
jgi:DNA-binding NarL/FixJ family response regulator